MSNPNTAETDVSQQPAQQKQNPPVLEEDDEFEDFPVEGEWTRCLSVAYAKLQSI
jgi:hypothetical protein